MINVDVTDNAIKKAKKYKVKNKLDKQVEFLRTNTKQPSLDFKPLESVQGVWRFRLDKHYWGLTTKDPTKPNTIRVYDVIKHLK